MKIFFNTRKDARQFASTGKSKGLYRKLVDTRKVNGKWSVEVNSSSLKVKREQMNTKYVLDKQLNTI